MAERKECEICRKAVQEKYKRYKVWKTLAILFICLTILFGALYLGTGDVFKETINRNDVEIVNNGYGNNNNNVVINN